MFGRVKVGVDGTLTGPGGNAVTGSQSDSLTSVGDLYPLASLKWNDGNHNFMAYTMAGVPVGSYELGRLANLGTNHWSLDAGGGYTYLDPKKGHEFSAVLGFTYNWENKDTQYKNGNDAHLDWAASQFFSEQLHAGLVGYFYQAGQRRQRCGRGARRLQVAGVGHRPAGRLLLSGGRSEVVPERQGLLRIRREEPARGLEHLGDACNPALTVCTGHLVRHRECNEVTK